MGGLVSHFELTHLEILTLTVSIIVHGDVELEGSSHQELPSLFFFFFRPGLLHLSMLTD